MGKILNIAHPNNPCNGSYGKCLDVKITNTCNGSCSFCIEKSGYCPKPAPVDYLIAATMALKDYQKVLVLGGEPFMYKHLPEYLDGIKDKEEVYITTNGSMLNGKTAGEVAPYLTAINISMHHYEEDRNAAVYGFHIPYVPIADAISVFRKAGVRVRINTNLIKGMFIDGEDLYDMSCFAAGIGADEIRFAELQYCADDYVPASAYIPGLPEDPFKMGCETVVPSFTEIKTIVRQTCGLVNPCKKRPENPVCCGSQTKVLYPNGEICDGWKTQATKKTETVGEVLQKVWPATCHTWLKTGGNPSCHDLARHRDLKKLADARVRTEGEAVTNTAYTTTVCHKNTRTGENNEKS